MDEHKNENRTGSFSGKASDATPVSAQVRSSKVPDMRNLRPAFVCLPILPDLVEYDTQSIRCRIQV